ncbi:MAG: hypothetical protein JXA71_12065 [Chitinispirillaceae bacterium]|nr:hypothetical protein [Chitinispirillaceae bacterium]
MRFTPLLLLAFLGMPYAGATLQDILVNGKAGRKNLEFGFSCGFTYSSIDLHRLQEDLGERFNIYRGYGISPSFIFPGHMDGLLFGFEAAFYERYSCHIGITSLDHRSGGLFRGTVITVPGNDTGGVQLTTDYSIWINAFELGVGYRVPLAYDHYVGIKAGASLYAASLNVYSEFTDTLSDLDTAQYQGDAGYYLLPTLSAAYSRFIASWLAVGISVRARYQRRSATLKNRDDGSMLNPVLRYSFKGIDANLFATFVLKK